MSIAAKCDICGTELEVDDRLAGNLTKCPKCKQDILVPEPIASSVRVSSRASGATLRRAVGADHSTRIQGSRRVAGYFASLGNTFLILCLAGAALAVVGIVFGETRAPVGVVSAIVLLGTGVFNFLLWHAVHYGLHLLADIEENTRLLR